MSNALPAGYRFGATYVGSKMLSLTEGFPLLMADLGPSGDLNANIIHAPTTHTRVKMMAQIQNRKWMSTQLTADWKGKLQTASLTLGKTSAVYFQTFSASVNASVAFAYLGFLLLITIENN